NSRRIWSKLKDLFRLIDQGNEELHIPPYNGGLFSRVAVGELEHGVFLETRDIGDRHLAKAIDLLGTGPSPDDPNEFVNIDYAGLEIRHLGSIYEGLLEYRLACADTDLVAIREKRGEVWTPQKKYEGKVPLDRLSNDV